MTNVDNAYIVLKERGFIYQVTDEEGIHKLLGAGPISCYIGFDPTASSLHVGSLVPIMSLAHMQRAGHHPVVIVGGGTAMVGDPSGKTEMRKLLTRDQIRANAEDLKRQLSRYLSFDEGQAVMLDNATWLAPLNYIEFLRDIGRHFSVNRMLSAESVKSRLESGLSFLEFNYMLLQSYDFYVLLRDHDVALQMGGQDQWGNIVAGIDLIRRLLNKEAYGMTFPLIENAGGQKFGKTEKGTVWLDAQRTSPYEFYQFWRNVEDSDVGRFLGLFTYLPMEEVRRLGSLEAPLINRAKEILAYEATRITHGEEKAAEVFRAALSQFGEADPGGTVETSSEITRIRGTRREALPTTEVSEGDLAAGIWIVKLLVDAGLCASRGEARRLISQGGVYVNEERLESPDLLIGTAHMRDGEVMLRAGKKRYCRVAATASPAEAPDRPEES